MMSMVRGVSGKELCRRRVCLFPPLSPLELEAAPLLLLLLFVPAEMSYIISVELSGVQLTLCTGMS